MTESDVNPAAAVSSGQPGPVTDEPPVRRPEHREGSFTRTLEQQAAKVESGVFLTAALGALVASVVLELTGRERAGRFVGMWPPTLLIMGVYNKLVKTLGPR